VLWFTESGADFLSRLWVRRSSCF